MASDKTHIVVVNGILYEVSLPTLTGSQIRALAGVPPEYALIVEGTGSDPDRRLADDEDMHLGPTPLRIFTAPPTVFG